MSRPWLRILTLMLLLAPAAAPAATAAGKPLVKVDFILAEPLYRDQLKAAQIRDLGTAVSSLLVGELSREVLFLGFTRDNAPFHLVFRLGAPQASKIAFHDVFFQAELTGPDGQRASTSWLFRDSSSWGNGIGSSSQLRTEIETSLGKHDMAELVPEVLSAIPVANDGFLVKDSKIRVGWVLPFRDEEVCMGFETEIKLEGETSSTLGRAPFETWANAYMIYNPPGRSPREDLRHCLLYQTSRNQKGYDMMEQSKPSEVRIGQVFVMRYERKCKKPLAPAAVSFGGTR
jgi:hypothetical protein